MSYSKLKKAVEKKEGKTSEKNEPADDSSKEVLVSHHDESAKLHMHLSTLHTALSGHPATHPDHAKLFNQIAARHDALADSHVKAKEAYDSGFGSGSGA